jgi:hypothetical protein
MEGQGGGDPLLMQRMREVLVGAQWDDGQLVKETALGSGTKVTETYTLAQPRQLIVTARLEEGAFQGW